MAQINVPLMDGEQIVYQGKINPLLTGFLVLGVVGLVLAFKIPFLGGIMVLSACVGAIKNFIRLKTSIFLVTNKRVIIRVGVLKQKSLELNLNKVESVFVETGLLDRANKMGTLVVAGTGGTKEAFKELADPQTFKLKLQEQLDAMHAGTSAKAANG